MYLPALLVHGAAIAFSRGGAHLLDELRRLEPTMLGSVPRLYDVLHATYQRRLRAAIAAEPDTPRATHEARCLAEARRAFGGRLQSLSVGSAPVSPEVLAFLRRCFAGLWVAEGYGSTEIGTIAVDGRVAAHVEVKLVPVPDLAAAPGGAETGEIWVRTPHAITGYLGDPAATAATRDGDGFLATGDLGERQADGTVRVVGRLRSAVKLAQGEFVAAERVEAALATAPIVDRVYVHAAAGAPALSALIFPARDALAELLAAPAATPLADLVARAEAAPAALAALRAHGRRAGLAAWEQPRAVLLAATPPTVGDGLLTASGKLARGAIARRFGAALTALACGDAPPDDLAITSASASTSASTSTSTSTSSAAAASASASSAASASTSAAASASSAASAATSAAASAATASPSATTTAAPASATTALAARLAAIVGHTLGRPIGLTEPLAAAGVDSLAAAEILAALGDDLGRDVPLALWFAAATIDELAARLTRVTPDDDASSPRAQAVADLAAGPHLPAPLPAARLPLTTVLLTGATGFLGAHLVETLVAHTALRVVCLVRATDDDGATARLAAALARHGVAAPPPGRVRALAADLAAPALGLAPAARDRLAAEVDAVVHAGAVVSWLAPYAGLRAANVGGTRALLELAASGDRARPFHLVSTISTAPADGDERTILDEPTALASTPYALSKWIAEVHARRAAAAGLPLAVYRPALIAGHSRRGGGNPDDFLHRYLAAVAELGLYLDLADATLDMTPVDFVARAIAALLIAAPAGGDTYHLANVDQSFSYARLGRALVAAGVAARPAPYAEFRAALLAAPSSRLAALASFFPAAGFALGSGPWPCARTVAALAALGVARPPVDDALVARYVRASLGNGPG